MAESRGIDVKRGADGSLIFLALILDSDGAKVTAGTTYVRIWHVIPTTGALEAYDFNDNTFKTTALTTATTTATHRTVDNATYNTGLWTYRHTTLTDFDADDEDQFIVEFANGNGYPEEQQRWFQYGSVEGEAAEAGDAMTLTAGERTAVATAIAVLDLVGYEATAKDGTRVGDMLAACRAGTAGGLGIVGTAVTLYEVDGVTVIWTATLDDAFIPTSRTAPA